MINVNREEGFCEIVGSGHELLVDVANIANGFCAASIKPLKGAAAHAAAKEMESLLTAAIKAGCAAALASVGATEEDADDAE